MDPQRQVRERDLDAALALEASRRRERLPTSSSALREVRCGDCGAENRFEGTLTSDHCPYCGAPLQIADAHAAVDRVPVDAVLPFLIARDAAHARLDAWVRTRWFAPSAFRTMSARGGFQGVYLPYWTFDAATSTSYSGERGEHYWVTVQVGKQTQRIRKTRWYPAAGAFRRFFDDVLVLGARDQGRDAMPSKHLRSLDPWPLDRILPFTEAALSGFMARTYDVELAPAFAEARERVEAALRVEVMRRIGGDEQRIHRLEAEFQALTYKHLLLPVWLQTYRFRDKPYRVAVNGATGEVCGERPWSLVKILLAVLGVAGVTVAIVLLTR